MGRYSRSRSRSPPRKKRYDDPRDRERSSRSSYRDTRRSSGPSGLLVRNISLDARPEDLRTPFERFGPVKDVYLPKNYYTGEPRGFGFVKFHNVEDAAEAKDQMNHQVIGGREIRIAFAEENRKTPQKMRMSARISDRYRRRSPPRSPRRRYRSYSRSPSPVRHGSRGSGRTSRYDYYSPERSISRSRSPRGGRSISRTPPQGRSISRSLSPRGRKSISRSPSPRGRSTSRSDQHLHGGENAYRGQLLLEGENPSQGQCPHDGEDPFQGLYLCEEEDQSQGLLVQEDPYLGPHLWIESTRTSGHRVQDRMAMVLQGLVLIALSADCLHGLPLVRRDGSFRALPRGK